MKGVQLPTGGYPGAYDDSLLLDAPIMEASEVTLRATVAGPVFFDGDEECRCSSPPVETVLWFFASQTSHPCWFLWWLSSFLACRVLSV